jgi:cytochrome c oxidase cbb3-type subunit 4
MDTYSITRQIADSWGLLAMFVLFAAIVVFAFRPGSRKIHNDISQIPFRHEDKPAPETAGQEALK